MFPYYYSFPTGRAGARSEEAVLSSYGTVPHAALRFQGKAETHAGVGGGVALPA